MTEAGSEPHDGETADLRPAVRAVRLAPIDLVARLLLRRAVWSEGNSQPPDRLWRAAATLHSVVDRSDDVR